jgi:minor histocompatibility antigen H13
MTSTLSSSRKHVPLPLSRQMANKSSRPMMVTVAKSLDVPIKLMFPRPGPADDPTGAPSHAMLGLGDVVLPGIVIGLALRFDLYLFYLRRQRRIPAATSGEEDTVVKPKYYSMAGRWSDYFWTHSLMGRPLWNTDLTQTRTPEAPITFPKTYFKAGLVGYVLGLLVTLGVMMVWNHAQPALLYLVPGVLGSVWLTALVRGEFSLMWNYTEEIEDEEKDKKTGDEKMSKSDNKGTEKTSNGTTTKDASTKSGSEDGQATDVKRIAGHRPEREVFSFSIEAPWQLKKPLSVRTDDKEKSASADASQQAHGEKHKWAPAKVTPGQDVDAEPSGKRVRLK